MTDTRKVSYVFLLVFYRDVKSQRIASHQRRTKPRQQASCTDNIVKSL